MSKTRTYITAIASLMLAACAEGEYLGDASNLVAPADNSDVIALATGGSSVSRATLGGGDAAAMLNNSFIVGGAKFNANGTGFDCQDVFKDYKVEWSKGSAGTSVTNTAGWEYVGKTNPASSITSQSVKYWDYGHSSYTFAAYSLGKSTGVTATAIGLSNNGGTSYELSGKAEELMKCYVSDYYTALNNTTYDDYKTNNPDLLKQSYVGKYQEAVTLRFRCLGAKVRIGFYETIPGYSVKDLKFYAADDATTTSNDATVYYKDSSGKSIFVKDGAQGKMVVDGMFGEETMELLVASRPYPRFPRLFKGFNLAQATFDGRADQLSSVFSIGALDYKTAKERKEPTAYYLGRTSNTATFAGTLLGDDHYKTVLPQYAALNVEDEVTASINLKVDYTLYSTDGSGETILVHGATAHIPAEYCRWEGNNAYTYLFKISDNTSGSTGTTSPEGLYPISFDGVTIDELDDVQQTITTIATPSVTTYQAGKVVTANNEYLKDVSIYAMIYGVTDLDDKTKTVLYELSGPTDVPFTEANVIASLQMQADGSPDAAGNITGRNGLTLTKIDHDATVTSIPNATGAPITVNQGEAAKFMPEEGKIYVFTYLVETGDPEYKYNGEQPAAKPTDWGTPGVWYLDQAGTEAVIAADGTVSKAYTYTEGSTAPTDWGTGVYYKDLECTTVADAAGQPFAAGTYYKKSADKETFTASRTYYKSALYNNNNTYAVKVIKVKSDTP